MAAAAAATVITPIHSNNSDDTPYTIGTTSSALTVLPSLEPSNPYPMVIADSGANRTMVNDIDFFQAPLSPLPPSAVVLLADNSSIPALGIGTASCTDGTNNFTLPNVLYVPQLTDSLYSLQEHWRTPGHDVRKTSEENLELVFPTFTTPLTLTTDLFAPIYPDTRLNDQVITAPQGTAAIDPIVANRAISTTINRSHHNYLKKLRKSSLYKKVRFQTSVEHSDTQTSVTKPIDDNGHASNADFPTLLRTRPPVSETPTYGSLGLPVQNPLYSDTVSGRALVDLLIAVPENLDALQRIPFCANWPL